MSYNLYKANMKKGISLIVLVITIIVIIILAGAVLLSLSQSNPINQASEATFKSNIGEYKSELALYEVNKYATSNGSFDQAKLNKTGSDIKTVITSMKDEDTTKFEIQKGQLVYVGSDTTEQKWISDLVLVQGTQTQIITVNAPVLATGMTPIKWDTSGNVVTTTSSDASWYNYANKQWANAQTADGSMWVWIPRYEYKISTPHSSTAQTIDVKFIDGTSTTPDNGYIMHPAFTFGTTELTGIWVAKFTASGTTSAVASKSSVTPLVSTAIDAIYTACRNMETANGSQYGWGTSGTGIDTHLMKNTEWGAVAYLSSSNYGKTGEVWMNPYYNSGIYKTRSSWDRCQRS